MSSRRIAKVAEALRETISTTVLFGLKDPRVKNVTVLRIEVSPDLKAARVFVSVMGDEKAQSLAMHGLRSARGFIQSQIADRLELRYTPILSFVLDPGVKVSIETSSIIRQALTDASAGAANGDAATDVGSTEDEESGDESTDEIGDNDSENGGSAADESNAVESFREESVAAEADGEAGDVPGSKLEQTTEKTGI